MNWSAWGMDSGKGLFILADGMGGHAQGGEAARAVVDAALGPPPVDATIAGKDWLLLKQKVEHAHRRVAQMAEEQGHAGDMGATLVGLWLTPAGYILATVGDSRAYLYRAGELTQLNEDHTVVQGYVNSGIISPAEAEVHPQRHLLRQAMGVGEVRPDFFEGKTRPGDRFVLSSDGLHGVLGDGAIAGALATHAGPQQAGQALLDLVDQKNGDDDATVLVVMLAKEGG